MNLCGPILLHEVLRAMVTGDERRLRRFKAGREFLLEQARERRKIPLVQRMYPLIAGQRLAAARDRMIVEALGVKA